MKINMVFSITQNKIFRSIIIFNPVFVMYNFLRSKVSSKLFFYNKPTPFNISITPFVKNVNIPVAFSKWFFMPRYMAFFKLCCRRMSFAFKCFTHFIFTFFRVMFSPKRIIFSKTSRHINPLIKKAVFGLLLEARLSVSTLLTALSRQKKSVLPIAILIIAFLLIPCQVYSVDTEVQDMADIVTPLVSDDMYIVDDPDATPASKKINIGALLGVATDLEVGGALSNDVVGTAEMADADHGDITWSGGVATLDTDSVSANELNATGVKAELEAVLDLPDLQGIAISTQGALGIDLSGVQDGGILVGTGANAFGIRTGVLTGGAAGYFKHELGGLEFDASGIQDGGMLVGTGAGTFGIRTGFLTGGAAGFLKHELGGLEADINAYTGLVAITGGATAEVDSKAELEGHIADVANFAEADGDVWTGVHDAGGATSFEIPNSATPMVDAEGEIAGDITDGQLLAYINGAERVFQETNYASMSIENLASADDNFEMGMWNDTVTIISIGVHCKGTCTVGADISLEDRSGNAMTHTTPTHSTGASDTTFQTVTAANILTAGEGLRFDVDNAVSPETDEYTITVGYKYNKQ